MVRINKDVFKSRTMVKNNPKTHTLLKPTFLGWQMATLRIAKITTNLISSFGCNQCWGYTTSIASIKSWAKNWPTNCVICLLITFAYYFSIGATTFHTYVLSQNQMPPFDCQMWLRYATQQTQKLTNLFMYLDLWSTKTYIFMSKINKGMEVSKHITLETRMIVKIHLTYIPFTNYHYCFELTKKMPCNWTNLSNEWIVSKNGIMTFNVNNVFRSITYKCKWLS